MSVSLLTCVALLVFTTARSDAAFRAAPSSRLQPAARHSLRGRAAARQRQLELTAHLERRYAARRRARRIAFLTRHRGHPGRTPVSSPASGPAHSGTTPTPTAPVARAPVGTTTPVTTPSSPSDGDPLAGDRFYVNPNDSAVTDEHSLQAEGQSSEAAQVGMIAAQPDATWLTSDSSAAEVQPIVSAAAAANQVPVLVVYNLPGRDCESYSAGGAASASDYESFIDQISSGLSQSKAVVILEPDALSDACITQSWYQLLSYALQKLDTDANANVYVDAGSPGWQSPTYEASGLAEVIGTARAGFSVNVSNFFATASDIAYGTLISQALGGRRFVIDTSRNGADVAAGQWCNPAGSGLGTAPTTDTGNPLVDADLWIKDPGESDGTCNGGPSAGQFWLSYALALVSNQG